MKLFNTHNSIYAMNHFFTEESFQGLGIPGLAGPATVLRFLHRKDYGQISDIILRFLMTYKQGKPIHATILEDLSSKHQNDTLEETSENLLNVCATFLFYFGHIS